MTGLTALNALEIAALKKGFWLNTRSRARSGRE
jgi:hypothetical protein